MSESSELEARTWDQLPGDRRREIVGLLGRMAHRRLGGTPSNKDPDDERDGAIRVRASAGLG
jgi:hypothetical protein